MLCTLIRQWCSFTAHMSPTLNGSSALQHFKRGKAVEICNGIMFHFYPGLPHIYRPQREHNETVRSNFQNEHWPRPQYLPPFSLLYDKTLGDQQWWPLGSLSQGYLHMWRRANERYYQTITAVSFPASLVPKPPPPRGEAWYTLLAHARTVCIRPLLGGAWGRG